MKSIRRLDNQVALIVGGGQIPGETIGNGRATALIFANEAQFITGVLLPVDGGLNLKRG